MRKSLLSLAILSALTLPNISFAEDAAPAAAAPVPTWTFPSSITLVSDYIWRGQSQTWGKPAVQAGIEADHASGFYAGFWASNVSSHWLLNSNLETDRSLGFRNTFMEDFRYDVGCTYVYYPSANFSKAPAAISAGTPYPSQKLDTLELYASLGWKWFTVKGGVNPTKFYGWTTGNSAPNVTPASFNGDLGAGVTGSTSGSGYVMASASYDVIPGLNIAGEVGSQMISNSTNLDWTWYKVGVTKSFDGSWAVNGFFTGTSGTNAYKGFSSFDNANDMKTIDKSKVVIGVTKSF